MNLAAHGNFDVDSPVALFGGGAWQPGSDGWKLSETIGELVTTKGHTLVTGGYGGAMEAASKGSHEAGGKPIGVLYAPEKVHRPNQYVQKSYVASDYMDRMAMLIRVPRAIALPGGSGTVAEIMASIALLRRFEGRKLAIWKPFWFDRFDPYLTELGPIAAGEADWVSTTDEVSEWLSIV
jgi:uncharacterized protein (TIGR00725 family)